MRWRIVSLLFAVTGCSPQAPEQAAAVDPLRRVVQAELQANPGCSACGSEPWIDLIEECTIIGVPAFYEGAREHLSVDLNRDVRAYERLAEVGEPGLTQYELEGVTFLGTAIRGATEECVDGLVPVGQRHG